MGSNDAWKRFLLTDHTCTSSSARGSIGGISDGSSRCRSKTGSIRTANNSRSRHCAVIVGVLDVVAFLVVVVLLVVAVVVVVGVVSAVVVVVVAVVIVVVDLLAIGVAVIAVLEEVGDTVRKEYD